MREILFRGKRVDNGEWVCGYYVLRKRPYFKDKGANFEHIICDNLVIDDFNDKHFVDTIPITYSVDPETVGQYTGLTDKNGRKIFEGDICKFKRFNDVHIGKVVFNVTTASFIMWYQPIVGAYGEKATQKMLLSVCDNIEVVGNIHDNPELME